MGKQRGIRSERGQIMIGIICLSFLLSAVAGAIAANYMGGEQVAYFGQEINTFFGEIREHGISRNTHFLPVYFKYIKYDILIWLGGWITGGVFLSVGVLLFRGISLGFTTAMLMKQFGMRGMLAATVSFVPQNIIIVPVFLFMTWAAIHFFVDMREKGVGRASLRRERQRKQAEYSILFGGSLACLAVASVLEVAVTPILMESISVFLV